MTRPMLPGTSVQLEHLAALGLAQIERTPIPLRTLYNPDTCPTPLLPYLAWAFSVDRWNPEWSDAAKRSAIKASHFIHSRKGTIGGLRRVIEPLGYLIDVEEWFQTDPPGPPGTFTLNVGVLDGGISDEMYQELTWLIDDAKPLTRHMTGLAIRQDTVGPLTLAARITEGEMIDVYPPIQPHPQHTGDAHDD